MGQVWNGSQWVVRAGAPETPPPEPEPDPESEDSDAENGEEDDAET